MSDSSPPDPIISELSGDADLIDIIEEFVAELPRRLDAMISAYEGENFAELRQLAHQLKGAAGGYGFPMITRSAYELERIADRDAPASPEDFRRELDSLTDLCNRARAK